MKTFIITTVDKGLSEMSGEVLRIAADRYVHTGSLGTIEFQVNVGTDDKPVHVKKAEIVRIPGLVVIEAEPAAK